MQAQWQQSRPESRLMGNAPQAGPAGSGVQQEHMEVDAE